MKTHTDERGLTRFFLEPKDAKTPDGPIVIDRDLLKSIRDLIASGAEEYSEMKEMSDKLDSLYPYLKC